MNKIFINGLKIENAVQKDNLIEIEGYCCHFDRPNLNREIVDESSFDKFFSMYNDGVITPKLNYNHDQNMLIGGIDEIVSFQEGLYMRAHLNKAVKIVEEMILPCIEAGDLDSFSTEGYIDNGWKGITENEDGTYYVKDFILTAVGVVPTPADWDAKFTLKNFVDENLAKRELENAKKSKWYLIR